jgi:hypothetical protein
LLRAKRNTRRSKRGRNVEANKHHHAGPDRGKTKQIWSRGRRRGTWNTGHHQHLAKDGRRRSGWRSEDGDVPVTPPTSPPPQRRQWENCATTRTGNICYRVVNTGPSESGKRAREREAEAAEKTRGRRINGRAKTLAAPRMDIFIAHMSPPRPPISGQNETGEHPLQPSPRDFSFPHSQAQGCFKGRDGLACGLA